MSINAVYRKGVFEPLEPMELPEHAEVRLEFIPKEPKAQDGEPRPSFLDALGARHFLPPRRGLGGHA